MKELKEIALKHNVEYISCLPFFEREGYSSVIIALLPYYCGERESYLSKYTRGKDYHQVGRKILSEILDEWGESDYEILIDVSPYNERELAYKAGLGKFGKNGLIINEKYGSFVFIATAFIKGEGELKFEEQGKCLECGKCISSCPGNAIRDDEIDYSCCLSHITQKRQITTEEESKIRNNGFVWGCDRCQDVCPMNKKICETPIKEFKENLLTELSDIDSLSQKEFKSKYSCYSLAYKGRNVIRRNIKIIKNT